MDRTLRWLVFGGSLVVLLLDAGGGPGWGEASARAVVAVQQRHLAASPLFDVLANLATLLPAGEPGFRLGVLAALIGAATLTGVAAAVSVLVPREPLAAFAGIALLLIAPVFREAAAFPTPSLLAACGAVWSIAIAARFVRSAVAARDARDVVIALAACGVVIGSTPWLGLAWTFAIAGWLVRAGAGRSVVAATFAGLGVAIIALWFSAQGSLPGAIGSMPATVAATGRGPAAIIVGAGLLGVGFGALTGLPNAAWLAALVVIAAVHDIVVGNSAIVLVAVLAVAVAIVPGAIVRAAAAQGSAIRRNLIAVGAGVPLVAAALATGPMLRVDDPGSTPAQLARDLEQGLPPGPGVFVATRSTSWITLDYAAIIAGVRPDLALVPPLPSDQADAIVATTLRAERVAGADAAAFGRLDVRRAIPRRRGFQLVGEIPDHAAPVLPPAQYPTRTGVEQATLLALERARHEAASGRLDAAARAAGLTSRFGAANLALLATTRPSKERPALFGYLPLSDEPPGPWLLDLFGDDLAWVVGIAVPPPPTDAPTPRKLHAKWRAILMGKATPDDPDIAALGPKAVAATRAVFVEKK
ncbi:MAG TPA: hypothetical protein VLB44_10610 [Kofleriaceae bacterium]|nr:hypothetical protein [Kofleriaceae bacterium]